MIVAKLASARCVLEKKWWLWLTILLTGALVAEVRELEFGREIDWNIATFDGVELLTDEHGFTRVSPLSVEWEADAATDLLLHFNEPNERDVTGRHRILNSYQPSRVSTQGGGALFLHGEEGVVLRPSADSFLGGKSSGSSFSIQFWFKPHYSADGEFLFEWDGLLLQDGLEIPQRLSAYFVEQRLVWEMNNLFLHPDQMRSSFRLRSDPLIPNRWYSHNLYYNAANNQLELLINNQVVAVQHSSTDGTSKGQPMTLLLSNPYRYPFVVGKKFYGYIDEFRIRTGVSQPVYFRQPVYRSVSSAVIGPLDLESNESHLLRVKANYRTPGRSKILFYSHLTNDLNGEDLPHPIDPSLRKVSDFADQDWHQLPLGENLERDGNYQGRYLFLKMMFLGDVGSLERPWLSKLLLRYDRPLPLPAPAGLRVEQVGADSLEVHWQPIADRRVAGYRIFLGSRSMIYLQQGYPVDVGQKSSYVIHGLQPAQQYYLTVVAYDRSIPDELGEYAPEQSIRLLPYFSPEPASEFDGPAAIHNSGVR